MITRTIRSLVVVVRATATPALVSSVNGARGQPPRRQRIRIVHGNAAAALRVGDEVADPVDGVGEVLAHLGLHFLVALEVGERERPPAAARQLQAVAAGVAGEVVLARERRVHARVLAAIEVANRIGRVVGLHAVDRLVDHGEADLRAHRLAGLVGDQHREGAGLARLRHGLVGGDRHLQRPRRRRHAEAPLGAVQPAVAQVGDADEHVADVAFVDRHLDRFGRGRPQQPEPRHVLAFLGDEHRAGDGFAADDQARRLAGWYVFRSDSSSR